MVKTFGELVKETRISNKLTLREAAAKIGITSTYLFDIERGKRNPPIPEKIKKMAEVLEADFGVMITMAMKARRAIELPLSAEGSSGKDELALMLARKWEGLSQEQVEELMRGLD